MASATVTISINSPNWDKVGVGAVLQAERFLQRVTTEEILQVSQRQRGEAYLIRVDNRWDKRIPEAKRKIQAFWQLPGSGALLRTIFGLLVPKTYRFAKRRTGLLGSSWRVYRKDAKGGFGAAVNRIIYNFGASIKINRTAPKLVGTSFPESVPPGTVYTFINVAKYGSLMSRYSAIIALRGSIAKSVAKSKSDTEFRISGRVRKLVRSVFYQNTPRGYSTVCRIRAAGRRAASRTQAIVRAFDLPPSGNLGYLKRISGVSVTYFGLLKQGDIAKQKRLN